MTQLRKLLGSVAIVAVLVAASGCASKNATSTAVGGVNPTALVSAAGLYNSLGGASGVSQLANAFGAKLALDPNVTKFLDAAAIDAAKGGLQNTLAALAGQSVPSGSKDLLGALSGKGLDAKALNGVSQALVGAGKDMKLSADQMTALQSVMTPIAQALGE